MNQVLWLSGAEVAQTGVCEVGDAQEIVEQSFTLFDSGQAAIVQESALRLGAAEQEQACYILPAYVGGGVGVSGLKWSAHGGSVIPDGPDHSRIHATILIQDAEGGIPLAVMNGTEIGAARTGAVTALALRQLAPLHTRKVALCGAGGQAEYQLRAILHALPQAREVAVWSRGNERNRALEERFRSSTSAELSAVPTLEQAVDGADVIIGATSAACPYLTAEHLRSASLYCHIGFHEITCGAVEQFHNIVVDTWEEAKTVSGQSLFRYYREGRLKEERITGTLGAVLSGRLDVSRGTRERKVMFDAFGLPIFDLAIAKEAYLRARRMEAGTWVPW